MNAKGKTLLRVTGVLELLFGAVMLTLLLTLLNQDADTSMLIFGKNPNSGTFFMLAGAYGQAIIQILAGLIGILFAAKPQRFKICKIFGMLLILIVVFNFINIEYNIQSITSQICATFIPAMYYWGACKNEQSLQH